MDVYGGPTLSAQESTRALGMDVTLVCVEDCQRRDRLVPLKWAVARQVSLLEFRPTERL